MHVYKVYFFYSCPLNDAVVPYIYYNYNYGASSSALRVVVFTHFSFTWRALEIGLEMDRIWLLFFFVFFYELCYVLSSSFTFCFQE